MARPLRLHLPDPLDGALAARARREMRSEADLVRQVLTDFLDLPEPRPMPDPHPEQPSTDDSDWRAMGGLRAAFTQVLAEHGAPTAELQSGSARLLALLLELGPTAEPDLPRRLEAVHQDLRYAAAFLRGSGGGDETVIELAREVERVAGRVAAAAAAVGR